MAKSLRSKFKRKVRAIKRVKNAPKELKMLQKAVENEKKHDASQDTAMADAAAAAATTATSAEKMETNAAGFNLKTLKKGDGTYPVWLSQRKVKEASKKNKAAKRKAKKVVKKSKKR